MSSRDTALHAPPSLARLRSSPSPFFSAFAVAFVLSVLAGFLTFLRELPSGDFHAEWGALVFFSLAAALLVPSLPRRFDVSPVLLLLSGTLALLLVLQAALGRYGHWQTPAFWLGYLLIATLAMLLGQGIRAAGLANETVNRFAWALAIAALLNTLAQIVQAAHRAGDLAPYVMPLLTCRPYGNTGQSNHAATLAWLGLASTMYLYAGRRLPSPLAMPLMALLLVGAALTASRMGWVLLAIVSATILFLPAWPGGARRDRVIAAATLVSGFAVASIGVAGVLVSLGPQCVSGLDRLAAANDASVGLRLDLWRQAVEVWKSSPWIGVGAYGFGPTAYSIVTLDAPRGLDIYAHNTFLQILAEFGVIGAGALVLVASLLIIGLLRARRQLTAADALLLVIVGCIAAHSMLEYPLWYTQFLLPFGLALGLLIRPEWARPTPILRLAVLGIAAGLLVAAGPIFADYRKLDRLAWMEIFRADMRAAKTPEVQGRFIDALADVQFFRVRAEFIATMGEPIDRVDLERKIETTDRLLKREVFPQLILRRIVLAILAGDEETARWHLRRVSGFLAHDTEKMAETLRRLVKARPDDFAALGRLIDEELVHPTRAAEQPARRMGKSNS